MKKWVNKIPQEYRRPVIVAIAFHVVLFLALAITFTTHPKIFQVQSATRTPIIHAQVISSKAYEKQQQEKRAAREAIKRREIARRREIQRRKDLAVKRKIERIAKAKAIKIAKAKKVKAVKRKQELAKKQKIEKLARERKAALKAFAQKAQKSKKQKLAKAQAAAAAAQKALTIKQKYVGLIQAVIRANWINQFNPLNKLQVTLKIYLDKKGDVESVHVVQSSGNTAFDRQAMVAVEKSSPLPIPAEADIASDFRTLTLPFSNQQVS